MNSFFSHSTLKWESLRPGFSIKTFARLLALGSMALAPLGVAAQERVDFSHLLLDEDSFWNGSDLSGGFVTQGAFFNNDYNTEWETWSGWAYSNVTDTETRGHQNQFAAITGGAVAEHGVYGIANVNYWEPFIPRIELPEHTFPGELILTNTVYSYYSMREGDDFAKAFSTEDQDWFRLTITGLDAEGAVTGEVEFYLADFRFEDAEDAYIIDEWTTVDIAELGEETRALRFDLDSSDTGAFGMNTPAYFALGQQTVIPDDPFKAWLAMLPEDQRPPEGKRGLLDDPAGDGVSNLQKYAYGAPPMTPLAADMRPAISFAQEEAADGSRRLAMEFIRSQTAAVQFALKGSSDLEEWERIGFTENVIGAVDDNRERVRFRSEVDPEEYGSYFLRLTVALEEE